MFLYESHLGGIYTTDCEQDYDDLCCEECGDSDRLLGEANTFEETWELSKDGCSFRGSGRLYPAVLLPGVVLPVRCHTGL